MKITILENGPILVKGPYKHNGQLINQSTIALCRCGHSKDKPFCDGSHKEENFVAKEELLNDIGEQ